MEEQIIGQYNIFDLGFNKLLSKVGADSSMPFSFLHNGLATASSFGSGFFDEVPPSQIGSGEISGNLTMVDGDLASGNFEEGVSGWKIDSDGNAWFNSMTLTGYISTGGAAADVNSGSVVIDGGKITVNGSSTFGTGYDPTEKLPTASAGNMAYEDLVEYAKLGTTVISGGYLQTALINADYIQAGTITSLTFRTAPVDNYRLELRKGSVAQANYIVWYDASNSLVASLISDTSGNLVILATTGISLSATTTAFTGNISMVAGKTVDGVDVSVLATSVVNHALDASAHHSSTSNALAITPASVNAGAGTIQTTGVVTGGYLRGTYLNINGTYANTNMINGNFYITGNLYFDASDRYIYRGTDIHLKLDNADLVCYRNFKPTTDSAYTCGSSGEYWSAVYSDSYPASPIQVAKSGIDTFKKIKGINNTNGKYTLETEDLPEEFKMEDKDGVKHTELKRTIGLAVQTIRELITKVELLESKLP